METRKNGKNSGTATMQAACTAKIENAPTNVCQQIDNHVADQANETNPVVTAALVNCAEVIRRLDVRS